MRHPRPTPPNNDGKVSHLTLSPEFPLDALPVDVVVVATYCCLALHGERPTVREREAMATEFLRTD